MSSSRCLFTVTTPRFVPGTLVMLGSFLSAHPAFDGDIAVAHNRLPRRLRELLCGALCRPIRFVSVSAALRERVAAVQSVRSRWRLPAACFYFVEAFRLRGYDRLLYCDSDLLFRGAVDELFDAEGELLAARDGPALAGMCRDATTFAPAGCAQGLLADTFNCGLVAFNLQRVDANCYDRLLSQLRPEVFRQVGSTDGFLLNKSFAGRQTLISSTYNYLVGDAANIRAREGLRLEDAKVLHFNNRVKPWLADEMLLWATPGNMRTRPAAAFKLWYAEYADLLAEIHVRQLAGAMRAAGIRSPRGKRIPPAG